jgi:Zn-dependent peptidase ImmA (M78 family)
MSRIEEMISKLRMRYKVTGRPFNGRDFYRICRGEDIGVIDSPDRFSFLMRMPAGEKFIVLPKRKRGRERLHAMYHELGHYFLLHAAERPEIAFGRAENNPHEIEADQFAELAMRPRSLY